MVRHGVEVTVSIVRMVSSSSLTISCASDSKSERMQLAAEKSIEKSTSFICFRVCVSGVCMCVVVYPKIYIFKELSGHLLDYGVVEAYTHGSCGIDHLFKISFSFSFFSLYGKNNYVMDSR